MSEANHRLGAEATTPEEREDERPSWGNQLAVWGMTEHDYVEYRTFLDSWESPDLRSDEYLALLQTPCQACGRPTVLTVASEFCAQCHDDELFATRPPDDAFARLGLLAALGAPLNHDNAIRIAVFDVENRRSRWRGWAVEEWLVHPFDPPSRLQPWHPWIEAVSADGARSLSVAVRYRVWKPGSPGWLTLWWHPRHGVDWAIRRIAPNRLEDATALIDLLLPAAKLGRPPGFRTLMRDEFIARLAAVSRSRLTSHKRLPAQDVAAREIGISYSTLRRYLKVYGVPWPPELP